MGSKDRILRLKEETRCNILDAALTIGKEEGWQALSMRKIADKIEYTAPIIYEYFSNKDALLSEVTKKGFTLLSMEMQKAKARHDTPAKQLEAMWMAYWDFAFAEKEFYQLMFGVEMNCCMDQVTLSDDVAKPSDLIWDVMRELTKEKNPSDDYICKWYYTFWSVVHGLISINIVRQGVSDEINQRVLSDAITGIINVISK
ncbi:TetR/AcrR family transcriptional regulator [Taibaiella helva]|uniref:TetR/AcrR family transcriptional regulator n=1 Tax=Taibaiella helva TaxID=2301235 RepID=UPI000E589F44|nr:TetR/AcrR family transcriptional regulator [Taibaiella helva]